MSLRLPASLLLPWQRAARALNRLSRRDYGLLLVLLPAALALLGHGLQPSPGRASLQAQLKAVDARLAGLPSAAQQPSAPALPPLASGHATATLLAGLAQAPLRLAGLDLVQSPASGNPPAAIARRLYVLNAEARFEHLGQLLHSAAARSPGLNWRGLEYRMQAYPWGQLRLTVEAFSQEPDHAP